VAKLTQKAIIGWDQLNFRGIVSPKTIKQLLECEYSVSQANSTDRLLRSAG